MKNSVAVILSLLSFSAFAIGVWTPWGYIGELQEYSSGIRVIGLDLSSNPAGCSYTTMALPRANEPEVDINRQNSMLIAAHISGKKVRIKLSDIECAQNYPAYYAVSVD